MTKNTATQQPTHWDIGEDIAMRYLAATDAETKSKLAKYCEDQGILASIVCHILQSRVSKAAARDFIQAMINYIEGIDEEEPVA